MAISAGQVYVDLGARLDRGEFEKYERELKKVQARTAKREHFKAELGANFNPRAFNAYERELKKADRANDNMVRSNGRLRTSFGSVWSKGGAAFAAAGGAYAVVTAVKSVVGAYGDAEASSKRVKTAVDNAGISYREHAKEIDKVIQAQSRLTKFDDEDLADTFARFVTQTKDVNEALRLNALAADVARGRQISLEAAQKLVARASQGNVGALKRLGIEIDPVTKSTDRLKDSTKKVSDATKDQAKQHDLVSTKQRAVAALQEKFGGQAKAYGKTQQGAIEGLSRAWENLREKLGEKLAPAITNVAGKASKFIDEMTTGRGEGGKFARTLERDVLPAVEHIGDALRIGGRLVGRFFEDFNENERQVGGWVTGFGRAESAVLKFTGKLVGGSAGRKLGEWGRNVDTNADKIDRWRRELRITREVDKIEDDLDRLKNKTNGTLHGILTATHRNMAAIRETMGDESAAGQRALGRNFQAAVTAIRRAMRQGNISTKTGLAQIRSEMLQELKSLGISSAERGGLPLSSKVPKGDLPVTTNSAPVTKYGGGWIGAPGMVGYDTVPAMLAPGEAVLNRHQQGVIESMLGDGFLDQLFARVQRPHFLARGGRALARFAGGGMAGAVAAANRLDSAHFPYLWGGGHSATPAPFGPMDCSGAVSYVLQNAGVNIPTLTSGLLAQRGNAGAGPITVFANPEHTYMRIGNRYFGTSGQNPGGGAGWFDGAPRPGFAVRHFGGSDMEGGFTGEFASAIKAPQVGGSGLLRGIVQGTLDKAAKGATAKVNQLAASMGIGTGDVGDPEGGTAPGGLNRVFPRHNLGQPGVRLTPNQVLGVAQGAGLPGRPFEQIAHGESDYHPGIIGHDPGGTLGYGLWQNTTGVNGPGFEAAVNKLGGWDQMLNPVKNAQAAKWLYDRGGLSHWYGTKYLTSNAPRGASRARGGFARYAKGKPGKPSKLVKTVGGATAGLIRKIRPVQTDRSGRFDALMASVDAADTNYSRWERRFNISDEELVDADTGLVNVGAIKRKAKELTQLIFIRAGMERDLEMARDIAKAAVLSYRKIVSALRKSLRHAKRKNRKGIRSYISQYEPRIAEWQGKVGEIGGTLFDTRSDVMELKGELKDVLGTVPNIPTPDTADTSTSDFADTSSGDTSTDSTPTAPSPLEIAEATSKELGTFLAGRQELLSSFGRNFVPASQAAGTFGAPDALTAAAGVRAFGAAGVGGGLGGATIINEYHQLPDNTQTWAEQMRFAVGG